MPDRGISDLGVLLFRAHPIIDQRPHINGSVFSVFRTEGIY